VSAVDTEPNAENLPVTGHLTFLGTCTEAFTGKKADLLAPLTKGRPNYVHPAITAAIGKKCTVTAEVDQETYDADPGTVFLTASKAQLITDSLPPVEPSIRTSPVTTDKVIAPTDDHPEVSIFEATPPKEIIEPTDANEEEVNSRLRNSL
jgi:hypothetical protein